MTTNQNCCAQYDSSDKLAGLQNMLHSGAPDGHSVRGLRQGEQRPRPGPGTDGLIGSTTGIGGHSVCERGDAVRNWVLDAASTALQNQAGERMTLPIVQKGLKDLTDIVLYSLVVFLT
jgi:hypothetical protein